MKKFGITDRLVLCPFSNNVTEVTLVIDECILFFLYQDSPEMEKGHALIYLSHISTLI